MKTPAFWKNKNRLSTALLPLSWLYALTVLIKRALTVQEKLSVPVLCIGNVTAGGSGKTPVALHVGGLLKARGVNAFYVSRGYGGSLRGPVLVNPEKHHSTQVGDEPLLLAQVLPTVVGKNRLEAAKFAIAQGAKLLIFDDGFQNKKFFKDVSLLVVDGTVGFGNGRLLPAGPLRETFSAAVKRVHAVVVINPGASVPAVPENVTLLTAKLKVIGLAEKLKGQKVVAFCGIAFPEKFRRTLEQLGARIIEFAAFADHAYYRHETLLPLAQIASREKAYMVSTRKDFVRLPHGFKDKVVIVDTELEFDKEAALAAHVEFLARLAQ